MKEINIGNFSGPLDLLLHLAKTNEIEITEISLDELIIQYLNFIKEIQDMGIDIASSYLEMAAELIRFKSMSLLPNSNVDDELNDVLEEIGLDRETLIKKLLEYKAYKEILPAFNSLIEKRQAFFERDIEPLLEYRKNNFENSITMEELNRATVNHLKVVHENFKDTKIIEHNELNIEKYIDDFKKMTLDIDFKEFIKTNPRNNVISLFLAVLESIKNQLITLKITEDNFIISKYEGEICNK